MARTAFGRREAYDNVAIGSEITTQECVLPDLSGAKAGVVAPAVLRETFAHGENLIGVGSASLIENQGIGVDGPTGERPGGA